MAGALPCPFLLALLLGEGDDTPWGRAAVPKTHPSWSRLLLDGVRFASPSPPNSTIFLLCRSQFSGDVMAFSEAEDMAWAADVDDAETAIGIGMVIKVDN